MIDNNIAKKLTDGELIIILRLTYLLLPMIGNSPVVSYLRVPGRGIRTEQASPGGRSGAL